MELKLLEVIDGEWIRPLDPRYRFYEIRIDRLHIYEDHIFKHMAEKNWFTEDYFWELLGLAKHYHPNTDFSRQIFESGKVFILQSVWDNFEHFSNINTTANKLRFNLK
jgi:hypothetical protein